MLGKSVEVINSLSEEGFEHLPPGLWFVLNSEETKYSTLDPQGRGCFVLQYSNSVPARINRTIVLRSAPANNGHIGVGVLGAGNFARMVLLPAIKRCKSLIPRVLCSAGGVSAAHIGRKFGFERATTEESEVFEDDSVGAVFSITQHDQHCCHVLQAIESGEML